MARLQPPFVLLLLNVKAPLAGRGSLMIAGHSRLEMPIPVVSRVGSARTHAVCNFHCTMIKLQECFFFVLVQNYFDFSRHGTGGSEHL